MGRKPLRGPAWAALDLGGEGGGGGAGGRRGGLRGLGRLVGRRRRWRRLLDLCLESTGQWGRVDGVWDDWGRRGWMHSLRTGPLSKTRRGDGSADWTAGGGEAGLNAQPRAI